MEVPAAASGAIPAAMIGSRIATAIAAKGMAVQRQQGDAIVAMVQQAAKLQSELSGGVDPLGRGGTIDLTA